MTKVPPNVKLVWWKTNLLWDLVINNFIAFLSHPNILCEEPGGKWWITIMPARFCGKELSRIRISWGALIMMIPCMDVLASREDRLEYIKCWANLMRRIKCVVTRGGEFNAKLILYITFNTVKIVFLFECGRFGYR